MADRPLGRVCLLFAGLAKCFVLAVAAHADSRAPDITLTGTISAADHQAYREVPFELPANVERLTLEFSYTGKSEKTVIDLGLRDPRRLRGWSGGNKSRVVLEEADATPSYLPGPLPAGTWHVLLGMPNVRKTSTATFTANLWIDRADATFPGFAPAPLRSGLHWYRGDLHMHTAHSDGTCRSRQGVEVPCPVFKTLEAAVAHGLDFIAVTDHNATSQSESLRELAPYFDDLLLIPGREVTTFQGHANVFGPTGALDFQIGSGRAPTLATLLTEVKNPHGVISINHPGVPSGEGCMGCGWTADDVDYGQIDAIEAVNGGTTNNTGSPEGKFSSLPFWEARLNAGLRTTGIGGSDNHDPDDRADQPSAVGVPTTVVHARELSQEAVLDAIRAGHVFIDVWGASPMSTAATRVNSGAQRVAPVLDLARAPEIAQSPKLARVLEVEAESGGLRAEMGDVLVAAAGSKVTISVHVAGTPRGALLSLASDAAPLAKLSDPKLSAAESRKTLTLSADGLPHWLRVDVRDSAGKLLLIGNPIYLRPRN